jgi:hypothetical protein
MTMPAKSSSYPFLKKKEMDDLLTALAELYINKEASRE